MAVRRFLFWAFAASIIVLPGWIMFGRALFGAPLGSGLFLFALLAPLFALGIAAVVGITFLRNEVRKPRAVMWRDVAWVGPWLLLILLYGFFVVVESQSGAGSAFSALAGPGVLGASSVISVILAYAIPIYGVVVFWKQMRAVARETQTRLKNFADRVQEESGGRPAPKQMDAEFSRPDAPQAGQRIILDGDDDSVAR